MSNIGLEIALRDSGIELVRCAVGDKYVMEEMIKRDLSIGGEQSGHIIFSDHLYHRRRHRDGAERAARDGGDRPRARGPRVRARDVSRRCSSTSACARSGSSDRFRPLPTALDRIEGRLAGEGRLLVRYSGTEPLLRVMIEGRNQQEIQGWASEIAAAVKEHL